MLSVWEANPVARFRRAREHRKGQTGTADSHGEGRGRPIQLHSLFILPGGLFALSCLSLHEVALFFCRCEQWPCTRQRSRTAASCECLQQRAAFITVQLMRQGPKTHQALAKITL